MDVRVAVAAVGAQHRRGIVAAVSSWSGRLAAATTTASGSPLALVSTLRLVPARGSNSAGAVVGDLIGKRLISVPVSATVDEALATMQRKGVRRLLVATPERRLAGIVSVDDLLVAMAARFGGLVGMLQTGMRHEHAQSEPGTATGTGSISVPAS